MNYKKKIICLLALFTIVVVNVLNVVALPAAATPVLWNIAEST